MSVPKRIVIQHIETEDLLLENGKVLVFKTMEDAQWFFDNRLVRTLDFQADTIRIAELIVFADDWTYFDLQKDID